MTKKLLTISYALPYVDGLRTVGFAGLLLSPGALWVGAHWSPGNKLLCLNVLPCLTLWVTLPGGNVP